MSTQAGTSYLDPVVLTAIHRMEVIARTVVEGVMAGLHRSPYKGASVEFTEHRPYHPGDEVRHIDWKAFAKRDRYYIKQFEEETNLRAYLAVDNSASMDYGGAGRLCKREYAFRIAASLAYLMLRQRDSVGLALFDREVREYVPPRGNRVHLRALIEALVQAKTGGETALSAVLPAIAERIERRGLVILISDLLDREDDVIASLRHLRGRHHEVVVFHVLDPDELELPFTGKVRFREPERGAEVLTNPSRLAAAYRERMRRFCERYRDGCAEHHVDYVSVNADVPLERALLNYLASRR